MQLIVLGMHRSGTSAVTRLLNMAGAHFGPEGIATDANDENPKGFWERRDVRRVCDGLLESAGSDWWKVADFDLDAVSGEDADEHVRTFRQIVVDMDAHRPWVMKEPRLCLLLPRLRPLLELPICIHVTREPLEVAASVARRNEFPVSIGVALWERYTLASVEASAGLPRYHLRHEDVLADPVASMFGLIDWLEGQGVDGLRSPSEREVTAFIDPDLHRQRRDPGTRGGHLNAEQAELARATEDGSFLDDSWLGRPPSAGGTEVLRVFELGRAAETEAATLRSQTAADRAELAAAVAEHERERRAAEARETELTTEVERVTTEAADEVARIEARHDDLERIAVDAVRQAERKLRVVERSRGWRMVERAMLARQTLTPGLRRQERGRIERVVDELRTVREALEARVSPASSTTAGEEARPATGSVDVLRAGVTVRHHGPSSPVLPGRPKVAVLAWDLGHNPLGRAYIMAELLSRRFDVELWGAQFERYGDRLWAPLRHPKIPVHAFDGTEFPDHRAAMEAVAERIDADALWVSKARLPSVALGVLAKRHRNRPLVWDVDDHELAFFGEDEGVSLDQLAVVSQDDLRLPFERAWTQACEPLVAEADAVTVSNEALRARFGGVIVPHARDERRFDPARHDRDAVRSRLGIGPTDRLLLFGGTPRAHKGVVEVLEALDRLGDPRYKLALFGTSELEEMRPLIAHFQRWIVPLPYQGFGEHAAIVAAADLSCVLQDPTHPVARYQMPAKVTDALALGVPCLVADLPPLRPLIDAGVLHVHDQTMPLHERIASIFDDVEGTTRTADAGRELFLREYSYEAVADRVAPLFDGLLEDVPEPSPALGELVDAPARLLGAGPSPTGPSRPAAAARRRRPGGRRWRAAPGEQYDLVMFWKQNDSSIYGRRQDMFLRYLERSGRFATIVHFDNPITPEKLYETYRAGRRSDHQHRFVLRQTVERLLHRRDDGIVRRTYLHTGPRSRRLPLPDRTGYVDYIRSVLGTHGVGAHRLTVFWVFPTNDDLPQVIDELDPDVVVADVVDDNRTWYEPDSPFHARIEDNYREVLDRADVVLANCEPVAEAMAPLAPRIHVVPNGCEPPDDSVRAVARPPELAGLDGPIVGYIGNLSDRIDIELLDDLARARPRWNLVLIGSAHRDGSILRLDRHENVHFLGVKPYEIAKEYLRAFDVALIPHVDNDMTRSMNPLKAFVYCAEGVPVVSTPIANLGELDGMVTIAEGAAGFLDAIDAALISGRRPPDPSLFEAHSWERRVERALALVDEAAGIGERVMETGSADGRPTQSAAPPGS